MMQDQEAPADHAGDAVVDVDGGQRVGQIHDAADREIEGARDDDEPLPHPGEHQRHGVVDGGRDLEIARQRRLLGPVDGAIDDDRHGEHGERENQADVLADEMGEPRWPAGREDRFRRHRELL